MDNENFAKFNLPFYLAVLFHLFVLALFVLAVSLENQTQIEKPFQIMQAAIVEEAPRLTEVETITQVQALSKAERKRIARAEKLAHRSEQQERKKFLAGVAQRMVLTAIEEKKLAQQAALQEKAQQEQKNPPLPKTEAKQANALSTPALENPVDEQKKNSTTASTLADERDV